MLPGGRNGEQHRGQRVGAARPPVTAAPSPRRLARGTSPANICRQRLQRSRTAEDRAQVAVSGQYLAFFCLRNYLFFIEICIFTRSEASIRRLWHKKRYWYIFTRIGASSISFLDVLKQVSGEYEIERVSSWVKKYLSSWNLVFLSKYQVAVSSKELVDGPKARFLIKY